MKFCLVCTRPDGDSTPVTSDQSLHDALSLSQTCPKSLRLTLLENAHLPTPPVVRTRTFWCNRCSGDTDIRFKCGHCPDFNLCEYCERITNPHDPTHILLKITPQAQALYGPLPTDAPLLPKTFSSPAPSPAPASRPLDLGSIFQSVAQLAQPPAGGQQPPQNPLGSIFAALQGLQQPPPTSSPSPQPDLGSLLSGLDLNQILGQAAGSIDLNKLLSSFAPPSHHHTPSAPPVATPIPHNESPSMSELRQTLISNGVPADQIDLILAASGGDPNVALGLLFDD